MNLEAALFTIISIPLLLIAVILFFYVRMRQKHKMFDAFALRIKPKKQQLQLKVNKSLLAKFVANKDEFLLNNQQDHSDVIIASTVAGLYSAGQYNSIDPSVVEAIDFAFTEDVSNFQQLHNFVQDKYINATEGDSLDGWITRLEGYVTEQVAADELTQLGYDVSFPEHANEKGYDLIVNGEYWQVKGGESVTVIEKHLAENPDIHVVTSSSLADQVNNTSVIGLDALEHDYVATMTAESLQGISDFGTDLGVGIPIATIAMTGLREANLLSQGKTDVNTMLKNGGLDIAGKGGGGLAGAKVGAVIGTVAGPPGMIVGGIIGGIAGSLAGGSIAKNFKEEPMRNAEQELTDVRNNMHNALLTEKTNQQQLLDKEIYYCNADLNEIHRKIVITMQKKINFYHEDVAFSRRKFVELAPTILTDIKSDLLAEKHKVQQAYKPRNVIAMYFAPRLQDVLFQELIDWLDHSIKTCTEAIEYFSVCATATQPEKFYNEVLMFFRQHEIGHSKLNPAITEIEKASANVPEIKDMATKKLIVHSTTHSKQIQRKMLESFTAINNVIDYYQPSFRTAKRKLEREREKLGYS